MQSTKHSGSPEIWRKWCAYVAISAALQRKVHIVIRGRQLFPNLYVVLVGPPGTGKSTSILYARNLLSEIPSIRMSPAKITPEKFISNLAQANTIEVKDNALNNHVSYNVLLSELSVFLRPGDQDFQFLLTDLFDCPHVFEYSTISRDTDRVENLFLNLLGGITTRSLGEVLGQSSIGMGLTARMFFIHAGEAIETDPFDGANKPEDLSTLKRDLEVIHLLRGPFSFEADAMESVRTWYYAGMPPIPADSRFAEYNPRRLTHWVKLAAIRCASRTDSMCITDADLERAKHDLLEAEQSMPAALELMGSNPLQDAIKQVHRWAVIQFAVKKTAIPEAELRAQLSGNVPPQYLHATVEMMVTSGMLTAAGGERPSRLFIPNAMAR